MKVFPYPTPPERPEELQAVFEFFSPYGIRIFNYGGLWRNRIALGSTQGTGDIDLRIPLKDWNYLPAKIKEQFKTTEAHKKFLKRMRLLRRPVDNLKYVKHMKRDIFPIPVEISLVKTWIPPEILILYDTDLGFCQIADDGKTVWVTDTFMQDIENQTMTVCRCNSIRDFRRTNRRLRKFENGLYKGWKRILPDHFNHLLIST